MAAVMVPASDHAPAVRSFDPADFPVPHGREEDWRFTPLTRLAGLLDGPASDVQATIDVQCPDGVEVRRLTETEVRELPVGTPIDRVSAHAWAGTKAFTLVRIPRESVIHDTITISRLLDTLKRAKGQLVLVADEFGTLQGLVTPIDVFEAIAGEFPDEDETPDIISDGENRWRMDGATDLHQLEQVLDTNGFVDEDDDYTTLAGYLLNYFGQLPNLGDICEHKRPEAIFTFEVVRIEGRRIALVNVAKQPIAADQEQGE
jgi:hypothetical protein